MKKKFYGALLVGSLLLAGGMVSCSDYDDDINSLTGRVDALEKTVADLKTAIESGSVITNVQSTENGVTVTLSDGKTFEVKNGTNGTPGSVIDIQTVDGVEYWFLDNKNTGYPVKGEKGDDGANGKDGIYYAPNATTGTWWKYDPNVENDEGTDTQISYLAAGTITAVYDKENGVLTLKNVDGVEDGTVVIPLYTKGLQSIALIPENYDTKMGMGVIDFYTISKDNKVLTSTNAIVNYRLNPNNANINDVTFDFIDRVVTTRAEGDAYQLLSIVGEPERQAGGEITVTAKSNKSLEDLKSATENKEAIVALRAQKTEDGETSEIVSDYAVVNVDNLTKFAIIDKADYANKKVNKYATTEDAVKAQTTIDGTIEYNSEDKTTSQLDLLTLVETYAEETVAEKTFTELGVAHTYKFTALDYTPLDGTNQKEFIEFVNDNTVQINKKWLNNGIAAVDKTPIIKVETLVEGEVVATAYIKLQIVQKDRTVKNVEINLGDIQYTEIDPAKTYALPWQRMNQEVLDELGLTNDAFGQNYNIPTFTTTESELRAYYWDQGKEVGTDICYIALNDKCKTGEQKAVITYQPKDNKAYPVINITFTYNLIHTQSFPELNADYQDKEDGAILVKGRLDGSQWKMNSEVKEHFKDYLADWTNPKYHSYPVLTIIAEGDNAYGVEITGNNIGNQVIKLTQPLTTDSKDVKVRLTSTMNNGEVCTKDYVVRFLRPYKVELNNVTLKTLTSAADTKDLNDYVVIKDREGKVLYANKTFTDEAKSTYKLDMSGMKFKFDLVKDASFGDKLSIDADGYTIRWDNGGNDLQNDKPATYKVTVTVPEIAELTTTGNITVLSTANSK